MYNSQIELQMPGSVPSAPVAENRLLPAVFSVREFEVSPKTEIDCAVYQMILDYNGTAMLFSDEYSRRDSAYVSNLKERLEAMLSVLNGR